MGENQLLKVISWDAFVGFRIYTVDHNFVPEKPTGLNGIAYTCNLNTSEAEAGRSELETNLGYIVNLKPAWVTEQDTALKENKNSKKDISIVKG